MELAYRRPMETRAAAAGATGGGAAWPAVVFLHAFPVDSRMWRGQLSALERRCDVWAPDFRGFGRTPAGEAEFTIADLADDVIQTLDAAEKPPAGPVVFAGCSLGGYVAFELWRRHPGRVAGLMLANTRAGADTDEVRAKRMAQIERLAAEGGGFLADAISQALPSPDVDPDLRAEIRGWMAEPNPDAVAKMLRALAARADSAPLLPTITVPTLVIAGERDTVTPPDLSETMAAAIPGARLNIFAGAGHLSPLEARAEFNQTLTAWMDATFLVVP